MADTPEEDQIAPGSEAEAAAELRSSGRKTIGLAALAIMVIHFLAKIGGYIQKKVLAHFFGTGLAADACTGMEKIFQLIFLIPEELLSHSLLPVFARARAEDGEEEAWRLASIAGTFQALLLILTTAAAIVWAPALVNLVLKGFAKDPEKFALTVRLVRWSMLGLFCTSIGSLTYVLLNAYKRFVTPALGDITQKIGIILGMVIVFYGFQELGPLGYAFGFILGGIFKLVTHLLALGSRLAMVRPSLDWRSPRLRELGLLMVPLLLGTLVSKVRDGWEQRIASEASDRIVGTLAALDYAKKIALMPVLVVPYALSKALFPFFADWASHDDRPRLTNAFNRSSRMIFFLFFPMSMTFVILREELVSLLYRGGEFTHESVLLTATPFVVYSLGLVAYSLEAIAIQVFYAYRDAKTPFYLGLIGSSLQIAIAYLAALVYNLGGGGIALGYMGAKSVKIALMWWQLRHRLDSFEWPALLSAAAKTVIASAVMGAWLLAVQYYTPLAIDIERLRGSFLLMAAYLGVTMMVGGGLFVGVAGALRMPELVEFAGLVRKKLKRKEG